MSMLRIFFRGHVLMSGLSLGACMPNLMFEHLAILEICTVNAQKMGSRDFEHAPIREFFSGVMSGLYLGSCMPNYKFATLAIL